MHKLLPYLLAPLYWLLTRTWRIEEKAPPAVMRDFVDRRGPSLPCLYAHWHGDELVLLGYYSFRRLAVLSSLSKDGSLMARSLELLGYQVFRGSSSRGGARGLIGLIRAVQKSSQAALAVDGPRGPLHEVKAGIVELARKTGQPVVPVRTYADRVWYIPRAWNHSYLPKPFARIHVEYGAPLFPAISATHSASAPGALSTEELAARVKAALDQLPGQGLRGQSGGNSVKNAGTY